MRRSWKGLRCLLALILNAFLGFVACRRAVCCAILVTFTGCPSFPRSLLNCRFNSTKNLVRLRGHTFLYSYLQYWPLLDSWEDSQRE
ncbi:hypothetical protein MLD38_014554 [Melastoma candidum]|uniref:Uncharacterized protein n=1 Tax=Melastoma candidum TaxID=119954 RepID=A0ACB9RD46_9MYRT|nr:hypothetical protein MLD38_014554 [Melastoma candidum]